MNSKFLPLKGKILDNYSYFDLFNLVCFFSLTEGLDHLIRSIDVFVGSNDIGNDREKSELACKMKMIVYLLCQLVELIEADVLQKVSFFYSCEVVKNCLSNSQNF